MVWPEAELHDPFHCLKLSSVNNDVFVTQKQEEWRIVFWITLIVYVIAVFFYTWLCSGERQPWALVNKRQVVEKDT